jgi:hypothetical protein
MVWGNDDFGLELDTPDKAKSEEIYNKIKDHTTQAELKGLGFQHG